MTMTETRVSSELQPVAVDLYRDIHKGIRALLFDVTLTLGRLDPASPTERTDVAARMHDLADLLVSHAEHEDRAIEPVLASHLPELAQRIAREHAEIDTGIDAWRRSADALGDATADVARFDTHRLYLDIASFTAEYLEHQDVEERLVMPALEQAIGVDAVVAIHQDIIGAIPPHEMAASLAVMLPAMNVDDRTEFFGGLAQGAPAEVVEGVWSLAASVLTADDHRALAARFGR